MTKPRRTGLTLVLGGLLTALAGGARCVAATPSPHPSDPFYDPATVQKIQLEVAAEDLARMQRALPKRIVVPGTFRWNDQIIEEVGIRYRGNSSSPPDWPFKRSFLISFSEYRRARQFLGLNHVALDNGIQFGGLFSERLITDVLRGVGVKASRCNYARVYLNGKPAGVYVNVERLDRSFLRRQFGSDRGPLFKVDEGGPGANLEFLGEDPDRYRKTFETPLDDDASVMTAVPRFLRAISDPAVSTADLERQFDLEAFLKTTAVMLFAGAFDQYTGWNPHNYYLYRDPSDGRWTYLPWDLDVGFADQAFGRIPVLAGWHAGWPAPVPGRPLMERLVSDPDLLGRYRKQATNILEGWFQPERLIPKLHGLHRQIQSALEEDPHPLRRATVPSDRGIDDVLTSMEGFIRERYASARAQLEAPGDRPAPRPVTPEPKSEGPKPGPPSADAPSDLTAVQVSAEGVELRWVDHAEGEVAFVVQRCVGQHCTEFENAVGQGGSNLTSAIDRQVQAGRTYRYRVYAVFPTPAGPRGSGVSNEIEVRIP